MVQLFLGQRPPPQPFDDFARLRRGMHPRVAPLEHRFCQRRLGPCAGEHVPGPAFEVAERVEDGRAPGAKLQAQRPQLDGIAAGPRRHRFRRADQFVQGHRAAPASRQQHRQRRERGQSMGCQPFEDGKKLVAEHHRAAVRLPGEHPTVLGPAPRFARTRAQIG